MDKNKKKQLMLTVIGLVGLIAITVGVSVAFFNYAKAGASDNTITTGSVMFTYTEVSGIGRGITLTDAIPMTDDLGIAQIGEGKVFEFKVSGKGANNASIPYEVTARMSSDSDLDQSKVRIYLEKDNSQVLLDDYSELDQTTKVNSNTYTERTLYKGKIPRNSGSNYTENFKLKMWLSSAAVSQNNEYPYSNKTFKITVNVYAEGNVYIQEDIDLEESANITSLAIGNGPALTASTDPSYDYDVTTTDRNITINVTPENENAQVTIEKVNSFAYNEESNIKRMTNSTAVSQQITLTGGDNYIKITVQPEDRSINPTIYKLHVYKEPSTVNTLSGLTISDCPLNETFDSETTSYTCTTTEPNLTVTSTTTDSGATYQVNGNTGLERGQNTITVVVTPEDTTAQTKTYTITVTANLPVTGSYSDTLEPVTLQGLAKMVYDDAVDNSTLKSGTPSNLNAIAPASDTGLWSSTATNSGQPTYYFRGNVTNNYVDFAGQTWRIVRINEDGTVRLISTVSVYIGRIQPSFTPYEYAYYTYEDSNVQAGNSQNAKTRLNNWYITNITNNGYGNKVATGAYYCEQAKVTYKSNYATLNKEILTVYNNYNSNYECEDDENGYGIVESNIGLITYDEYVYAGGYVSTTNNNFYLSNYSNMMIMSPAGGIGSFYTVWNTYGSMLNDPNSQSSSSSHNFYPVINLKANVTATKDTTTGHYVVN